MTLSAPRAQTPRPVPRRTIPFDYAFRYDLTGKPGKVLRQIVTVSIEAKFVAVSIGYGAIPILEKATKTFGILPRAAAALKNPTLRAVTLGHVIDGLAEASDEAPLEEAIGPGVAAALGNGIRLNPEFAEDVLLGQGTSSLKEEVFANLFRTVAPPPEQIQFKYAIFDDGSGREFQSEPILNIAGLGISNGDRPFRYFARPIAFDPQATIRMEVTEVSEFQGELHVSLQGYKVLGDPRSPTGRIRRRAGRSRGR